MKTTFDIIILSIGFWLAAIKLFMALHPDAIDKPVSQPPLQVIEERPDPEVEAIRKAAAAAIDKAQEQRMADDEAKKKAEQQAAAISRNAEDLIQHANKQREE